MGEPLANLDALFARHLPALTAFLRHKVGGDLRAREGIEDLAQSACREVLDDLENLQFRGEEAFRSYLFLQATRKVLDRHRYHHRPRRDVGRTDPLPEETRQIEDAGIYSPLATPSQCADARERLLRVQQLLHQLPEAQRDAIFLTRIAGLSNAEVAAHSGVSESALRGLVARGLARLSILMEVKPS